MQTIFGYLLHLKGLWRFCWSIMAISEMQLWHLTSQSCKAFADVLAGARDLCRAPRAAGDPVPCALVTG